MDEITLLRIDSLLKRVDQVLNDTNGVTLEELRRSNLLLRATGFSIAQIGETMNQLAKTLGEKYWNLPWAGARKRRNINVHDYRNADVEQVYSTIVEDLPNLKTAFLAIKNDVQFNVIETERLILRKVRGEDAEPMFRNWASDPEVTKYVTWPPHESIQTSNAVIQRWIKEESDPKTIRYMITTKESDEPIGSIDVVDYVDGAPEIGYCLSRKHWGKGYMTEACKAFIKYLMDIGFSKIVIEANVENLASNRIIQKCGFVFTHQEHKEQSSRFKPEPITVNWYEINK